MSDHVSNVGKAVTASLRKEAGMSEAKYPKPPWVVRKNPMRDDGWFIQQANPEVLMGTWNPDGSRRLDWKGVLGFQLSDKSLADFIVQACNSHYDLVEACKAASAMLHSILNIEGSSTLPLQLRQAINKATEKRRLE